MISINKKHLDAWLTLFCVIYVSRDTLIFGTNDNEPVVQVGYGIILVMTVAYLFRLFTMSRNTAVSKKLITLLVLNVCTMIINFDFSMKYVYACAIIVLAYSISRRISFECFIASLKSVIILLASCSLVGTVAYYLAKPVLAAAPVLVNESGYEFNNLFLTLVPSDRMYFFYRNYGIFREPGMFVLFLTLGLMLELFGREEKVNFKNVVILIGAMALTYSTAGYFLLFIVMLTFSLGKSKSTDKNLKIVAFFFLLAAVIYVLLDDDLFRKVFKKLFIENDSLTSRIGAVLINIKMALRDPLHLVLGNGFAYTEEQFIAIGYELFNMHTHNTNTLLKMLSVNGIVYVCICAYSIAAFVKRIAQDKLTYIGLLLSMVLAMFNEDMILNIIIYLFIFYSDKSSYAPAEQDKLKI